MSTVKWTSDRPHTLVVACSDGRLQEQTDEFLHGELGLAGFDRFYVPGGGGALASSGRDFLRAQQLRKECAYLIAMHEVSKVILVFHGPVDGGSPDAVCADYKRKMPWATPTAVNQQQRIDAIELIETSSEWAGTAEVVAYHSEVAADHDVEFVAFKG